MRKYIILLIILVLTIAVNAADKWVLYAEDTSSAGFVYKYYYDATSITKPSGDVVRLWLQYKKYDVKDNLLRMGKTYEELNCSDRSLDQIENILTYNGGSPTYTYQNTTGKKKIVEGSADEKLFTAFCKKIKKPSSVIKIY